MSNTIPITTIGNAADEHYITARGLGLNTVRVRGYSAIDLDIPKATVHAVCGEHRSGKTELLLTLAGRMHANAGTLTVGGAPVATLRDVATLRRTSGLGFFDNVNDVSAALTVRTVTSAELSLAGRPSRRADTARYLEEWHLDAVAGRTIGSLPRYTYDLLGIALGACGNPRILAVHDVERDLTEHQSLKLVAIMRELAHTHGTTIVCGVTDYARAIRFDGVTCVSDAARAQRDAATPARRTTRAA